jgi:hypothetical protein
MVRLCRFYISFVIAAMSTICHAKFLYHGTCTLKSDPIRTSQSLINLCINANANMIGAQRTKNEDNKPPSSLLYASGDLSLFLTPYVSVHTRGHSQQLIAREDQKSYSRESKRDAFSIQIGNNALSRHRISAGQGRPQTTINHDQRPNMEFIWGIQKFEAPIVDFATYTYDNQVDWIVQTTYGRLPADSISEKQRLFGSTRIMYDVAALEGTRFVLGGFGDGLLRRSVNFGVLNINGRGDETAFEIARQFNLFPYDPKEFTQQIKLSYLSREQDRSRFKFQYDDHFRRARIGGIGGISYFLNYIELESQIGYAKREDQPRFSHWFLIMRIGVQS